MAKGKKVNKNNNSNLKRKRLLKSRQTRAKKPRISNRSKLAEKLRKELKGKVVIDVNKLSNRQIIKHGRIIKRLSLRKSKLGSIKKKRKKRTM